MASKLSIFAIYKKCPDISRGTKFDPARPRTGAYRKRKEREEFVAAELEKLSLFEVE